ncbi:unnamed protein product [Brassica rapa subsp. narinosa]
MNAWLPQASYPWGIFSDTSSFKFRRSKGSIGHAFTMCRPSQTPHLTMSSAQIDPPKRVLGLKEGVVTPPPIHGVSKITQIPLVRTSSELAVRPPGNDPERAVPSLSPGRHEAVHSRHVSSSSSPPTVNGFGTGSPKPSPQSQSFSQIYGSILPTSLVYIIPSTRGCSPWRPDAVMSMTKRERHPVFQIFKGHRECTGHHATCGALPAAGPYLQLSRFQDERFARQYRCGPPPEFPLASPRSGIVHHLSGPDRHAHTRTLLRRSRSIGCAPVRDPDNQLPCALWVYSPVDSHTCQTPWSVPGLGHHLNPRRSMARIDRQTGLLRSASDRDESPAPIRFPPKKFKHSLTLFSKSYSSLPRGTCALSVSRPYLALDRVYRQIGAAFPNNPTRRQHLVVRQGPGTTGVSPSLTPLSRELGPGPSLRTHLQTIIRTPKTSDIQAGVFPVRSPLLRESLLVSFPPFIDMLKLSG